MLGSLLPLGTGKLGVTLTLVSLLESLCCLNLFSGDCYSGSLSLLLATLGIGIGDVDLGGILTLDSQGIGGSRLDTGVPLGLCDPDVLVPVCLCLTDLTETVLLGNTLLGIIDGLCSSLLAESLDVAGLVTDIGHVDIDELQTDLAELSLHILADCSEELVAVGIDFLDVHRGDHKTELTEKNVGCDVLDVVDRKTKEALSCIRHAVGLGRDTDSEAARHIHADVLLGKCIGQVALDGNRLEVKECIILENRPDERSAAMDTSCGRDRTAAVLSGLTVDDHDLVGRTTLVAFENCRECHEQNDNDDKDDFDSHNL